MSENPTEGTDDGGFTMPGETGLPDETSLEGPADSGAGDETVPGHEDGGADGGADASQ